MTTQEVMTTEAAVKQTKLIEGVYNTNQAKDLVISLIDSQINFYKLESLRAWEACHSNPGAQWNNKIEELTKKKEELKEMLNTAKLGGFDISITGAFEMKLAK